MALIIKLKRDEIITINGCRVVACRSCDIALLDHADVVMPNGTVKPRQIVEAATVEQDV